MNKVLVFGAGITSEKVLELIDYSKVKIVGIIDNDYYKVGQLFRGIKISSILDIYSYDYDYILVSSMYFIDIYKQLIALGIKKGIIINTLSVLDPNYFKMDKSNIYSSSRKLVITGLSYSRGIDTELLYEKGLNYAMNSQDLFFDYCIIKSILKHKNRFPNLKYCIIGLSHYSFHYDMLKSKSKGLVYRYDPIIETLIEENDKKTSDIKSIKEDYGIEHINFEQEFPLKIFIDNYQQKFDKLKHSIVDIEKHSKSVSLLNSNKNYPLTVAENKNILNNYLVLLLQNNIKPIIVINPQNKIYRRYFSEKLEIEFNEIIEEFKNKFMFQYLNFYKSKEFVLEDYIDGHHLNYLGNKKLTKLINKSIDW